MAAKRLAELARLVPKSGALADRRLLCEEPPTLREVVRGVALPFAARYVEEALTPDARQLSSPPLPPYSNALNSC